jgi:hypothetical protein
MSGGSGGRRGVVILCADDYAMTAGISASIDALAAAGRLSAASVMVNTRHWPAHGGRARALRGAIAVGLHFNLTLGTPLGPMPVLAPTGRFPDIGTLTARALKGELDADEIAGEAARQIDRFEDAVGYPPDHFDGHQHVHALHGVRQGVLAALAARTWATPPLVRDPADTLGGIVRRRTAVAKSAALWWLTRGFGDAARAKGFPVNGSFAGVTDFTPTAAEGELRRADAATSGLHLVMCHPGHPDAELAAIDRVTERRRVEHDLLMRDGLYGARLWRPQRAADGAPVDWRTLAGEHR